jgi:hypothetical protein
VIRCGSWRARGRHRALHSPAEDNLGAPGARRRCISGSGPASRWGITELYDDREGISLEYIFFPAFFAETFMIDHENALNYKQQVGKLAALDTLNTQVITLKDSVFVLERQKSVAFRTGYDSAFTKVRGAQRGLHRVPEESEGRNQVPGLGWRSWARRRSVWSSVRRSR